MDQDLQRRLDMDALDRAIIRALRKEHRGPAYRRAIFRASFGLAMILGIIPGVFAFFGELLNLISEVMVLGLGYPLAFIERWAYPGLVDKAAVVITPRTSERKATRGDVR